MVAHWRVTVAGHFGATAAAGYEEWSFGLRLAAPDGQGSGLLPTDAGSGEFSNSGTKEYQGAVNDIRDDVVSYLGGVQAKLFNYCWVDEVKLALIGADGLYASDPYIATPDPALKGPSSGSQYPPQLAMAVSLETGRRGPTGRGRYYLPMPNAPLTQEGLMPAGDAQAFASAAATFITNLNEWPGAEPGTAAVVSVVSSKGYATPVTGVRVGNRVDVMRSRAGRIQETYATAAVTG